MAGLGLGLLGGAGSFSPPVAGLGLGLLERAMRGAAAGSPSSAVLHAATSTSTLAGLGGAAPGGCSALPAQGASCAYGESQQQAVLGGGAAVQHICSTRTTVTALLAASSSAELTTARVATPPRPTTGTGYRTGNLQLAVVAKKGGRKRRRRPSPGRGGGGDDRWGGGGDDNGGNGGGDDRWWEEGGEGEGEDGGREADRLVLWNLLCFFSLLQSLHFGACQALSCASPGGVPNNLVLTSALFGGGRKAVAA